MPGVSQLMKEKMPIFSQIHLSCRTHGLPRLHHAAQMSGHIWITEMLEIKLCSLKDEHLKNLGVVAAYG